MKIPKIIYSDKILNRLSWFMKIGGITLWPWIILREYYTHKYYAHKAERVINHESIHIQQQQETLVIPFYIWYGLEWFIKLFRYGSPTKAYRKISFEQEAYENENNKGYLNERKRFAWLRYIFK